MSEQNTSSNQEKNLMLEKALKKKERRKVYALIIIGLSALMVGFLFPNIAPEFLDDPASKITLTVPFLLGVLVVGPVCVILFGHILNFIRSKSGAWLSSASIERDFGSQIETLRREFSKTASVAAQKAAGDLVDSVDNRIAEQLREKIGNTIKDDVVSLVGRQVAEASEEHYWRQQMQENLTDQFNTSRNRIDDLAKRSARHAFLFRLTGFYLAFIGLGVLGWNILEFYNVGFSTYIGAWQAYLAAHAVTIFPFVFFAEVLALVMFRYSSRAQEQTRYYANEVTTLHLRLAAGLLILQQGTKEEIVSYAQELGRLERNRILTKGEAALEPLNHGGGVDDEMIKKIIRGVVNATTAAGKES